MGCCFLCVFTQAFGFVAELHMMGILSYHFESYKIVVIYGTTITDFVSTGIHHHISLHSYPPIEKTN